MSLPLLYDVQETSRAAYQVILPTLPERERAVIEALARFTIPPTSYELYHHMSIRRDAVDLNSVRPRLSALSKRGVIVKGPKRACSITGFTAFTWSLKE